MHRRFQVRNIHLRHLLLWIALFCIALLCLGAGLFSRIPAAVLLPASATSITTDATAATIAQARSTQNTAQSINFEPHFRDLGVEGSILIYDPQSDRAYQYNASRNATAFLPGSTFKIFNSLVALETGVISDEIAVLTWDGVPRSIAAWNRDLNMREAIKLSAVWFYQVLARRIGHERMQKWIMQVGYGNQQIGSPSDIDKFWLEGELRITAQQQIQFLQRLVKNELPFSARSLAIVKDILVMEQTPTYKLRGKTGWVGFGNPTSPQIGWYVGYLEKGDATYFFATNIDIRTDKDPAARVELTRRCLKDLALLP